MFRRSGGDFRLYSIEFDAVRRQAVEAIAHLDGLS